MDREILAIEQIQNYNRGEIEVAIATTIQNSLLVLKRLMKIRRGWMSI
jgi:hypothetical protein